MLKSCSHLVHENGYLKDQNDEIKKMVKTDEQRAYRELHQSELGQMQMEFFHMLDN